MGDIDPDQHKSYLQGLEDLVAKSKKLSVDGEDDFDQTEESSSDMN